MTSLILKIILQSLAVLIAILISVLDYVFHDKNTTVFKYWRKWLFIFSGCFLIASIVVTIVDTLENDKKEKTFKTQFDKLQSQNDNLQAAVSVLSKDNRSQFVSLLKEQENVGSETAKHIRGSADLLRTRIDNSISLLNRSTKEINRANNPIKDITISCNLSNPLKTTHGEVYRNRIEKAIIALAKHKNGLQAMGIVYGNEGNVTKIGILDPPYTPDKSKEFAVYVTTTMVDLTVDFFKTPVPIATLIANKITPDMQLFVSGGYNNDRNSNVISYETIGSNVQLQYVMKNRNFTIGGSNLSPRVQRNITGKIISIPDLSGAQLVIRVGGGFTRSDEEKVTAEIKEIYRTTKITNLEIRMSGGREFKISESELHQYSDKNNNVFFVYKFPDSLWLQKEMSRRNEQKK
jgi:hypothetical protein